jgi:RNA polymerase sigma-70 factor (ECF subfamily)
VDSGETDEALWFAREVQPHEAMLRAWLRSRFSDEGDLDDLVQDAFVRVLRARAGGTIRSPKAFLFATARNLALDRLRHRRVTGGNFPVEFDTLALVDETGDVPEAVARSEEIEILARAIQSLPTRCRQVLTLRKIYGLSQKEIAARLGIAEHTVESQGAIGLRKCTEFFSRHNRTYVSPP